MPRGGKRPGAGRKKGSQVRKSLEAKKNWAAKILTDEIEVRVWNELLNDPRERGGAVKFLSDHKYGKAPQGVEIGGNDKKPVRIVIEHIGLDGSTATETESST